MPGDYNCNICGRGLYHWQIKGMDPNGQPLCETCAQRPATLTPKEQYKAWYGFLRRYRDAQESESADSYPIGFDCPSYGHCDPCYCELADEQDREIQQRVKSQKAWLPDLVHPAIKVAAQQTYGEKWALNPGEPFCFYNHHGNNLGIVLGRFDLRDRDRITDGIRYRQELGSWEAVWEKYPGLAGRFLGGATGRYKRQITLTDRQIMAREMLRHYPHRREWWEENRPSLLGQLPWERVR